MEIKFLKWSGISRIQVKQLFYRSFIFLVVAAVYFVQRFVLGRNADSFLQENTVIVWIAAAVYYWEMIERLFYTPKESRGRNKQFKACYNPVETEEAPILTPGYRPLIVAVSWILFNAVIKYLEVIGIFDQGILFLFSLAFAICDVVCVLFFCPFHKFMLKHKCCVTCRIYNWGYPMMFTPCVFIHHPAAKVLVILALAVLVEWEINYNRHPERFAENTNSNLQCINCNEHLCSHKKALQKTLGAYRKRFAAEKEKAQAALAKQKERVGETLKSEKELIGGTLKNEKNLIGETLKNEKEIISTAVKTEKKIIKEMFKDE